MTWATSQTASGPDAPGTTTPCASNTAGSLTGGSARYTASYSYDTLDRLTSGPADGGSTYTYGDSAHLHAATSTSGGYSATYDASGNMVCRAPSSSTTCTGSSPTGAGLSYDNEGQLTHWTSALNGTPTPNTASFAYDGEGSRVAQQTTTAGTGITTTTEYLLGGLEEEQSVGGSVPPSTTLTEYYPLPGLGTAVQVTSGGTSTLSYLASDQLGSVSVALSTSGTVTAQQLYSPYGTVRYASGSMPTVTDHGYTGQVADATTGLDDYGARYYDPALGQFTSADSILDGLNRYAYVGGNPESASDPSGHKPEDAPLLLVALSADPFVLAVEVVLAASLLLYEIHTDSHPAVNSQYQGAVPAPAPTAQPVWGPPAASPGSSQWTLPDKDYIRGAENAHPAPPPHNGPTNKPGPGTPPVTGPSAGPGTPPATQTGSGGANGGAGVTPPTGSCGCWPDESGGGWSGKVWVSEKGLSIVEAHLSGEFASEYNDAMIARLKAALEAGTPISGADANFYLHELSETTFMAKGLDYDAAHEAALAKYGVSRFSIYHPEVIQQFSGWFNNDWKRYWGLPCSE